ncbi:MAG: serine/threonine-protein phosphatase [Desulfobacteraceae bacterium]|jgi:protein phosphatase|nr:MAG: serine/threonine-protein phosphatase [Desulfobacteraceae bacterium]
MPRYGYGAGTDTGRIRSHNEDCFRAEPELGLWLVADGMGGHQGGEVASTIAGDVIVDKIQSGQSLVVTIEAAHNAILEAGRAGEGPAGMGTTVVALQINHHEYEIAWVGDCRAYLWNGAHLKQLTRDHSYVQYLVDQRVIPAAEADHHGHQNYIMQALGSTDPDGIRVDAIRDVLHRGERILLCSDGLTKEVSDADIAALLSTGLDEQETVDRLIQTALENGGSDNVTVVLVSADIDAPRRSLKRLPQNHIFDAFRARIKAFFKYFTN